MARHRTVLLVSLLCLTSAFAGIHALVASNLGFLVNCPLRAAGPGSRSGTNPVNLPYQRDAQLLTGGAIMNDVGLFNVANVQRFLESTDGIQVYTGRKGLWPPVSITDPGLPGGLDPLQFVDFPLSTGECYFIRMVTTVNYVVGGSSDPTVTLTLDAGGMGSNSGTNFVGLPYHAVASTASQLMQDIGFANVANVQRFVTETDTLQVYTGRKGSGADFTLDPCECYFIKMNTTVNYIPTHY